MTRQGLMSNVRTLALRFEGVILLAQLTAALVALVGIGLSLASLIRLIA